MKNGNKKSLRQPRAASVSLATPLVAAVSRAPETARPADPLHILLVEDNMMDIALIGHLLRSTGREIVLTTVETCAEFEAEFKRRQPHLVLSDYSLPTFNGSQALALALELAPDVPFIFVTGTMGEEVAIDMLTRGATDYVLKNRLTRLSPAVNRALAESAQRREHTQAEEKLQRSHDQLRALTGHLQFVREEERTRIAREVHDELGQALTGLRLDLSWLSGKFHGARAPRRKIKSMSAQIDATIQAIRRIATELRPGVLDSLGLAAAIEWQAAEFQERTGITCELKVEVTETMWEREFSTACFRIFQETLTNITRHAHAKHVVVRLAQKGADFLLTISDDGRGITEKQITHPGSIGLIGMKERAAQAGGDVSFTRSPVGGTTVTLRVPLAATVVASQGPP
jgi:signal transduction histidine kinase